MAVERVVERVIAGQWAVGDAARRSDGLADLLARITRAAADSVGASAAAYWRIEEGRATLAGGAVPPLPAGAQAQALSLDAALQNRDWEVHRGPAGDPRDEIVAVVWRAGGIRLGIACAYRPKAPEGFTEEDALVLQVISNSCGNVVQREEMVDRLRHAMNELHAAESRLGRVLDLSQSLNSISDPQALLDLLLSGARELVGAGGGFVGLARPEGLVVEHVVRAGRDEPLRHTWGPGDGIPGWCLLSRAIYVANDLARDGRADEPVRELGISEILSAPIVDAQDQVLGLFALFDKPGGFTADDRHVALALASHTAMALRNAIAYQRLEELERFKSDFLNLAAHELRGPIATARGYLEMLSEDFDRWSAVQRRSMLGVSTRKLDQMRLLVDQMLETARLEDHRPELHLQDSDLREVARAAVKEVSFAIRPEHRLQLDLGADPVIASVDRERLQRALANLVENACKYSPDGGLVRVDLTIAGTPPWAELAVQDEGLGIDEADRERLFTRFGRIVTKRNSHIGGTGLGLYLARQLARLHGGDILVESEVGRGSRFVVRLPLASAGACEQPPSAAS